MSGELDWAELRAGRDFRPGGRRIRGAGDQVGALDRAFLDFASRQNRGATDGPSEYHYEYRLVVATKG
jgi:hypothetical protein